MVWLRRISEILYTIAFFAFGIWAIISGGATLLGGLEDINMTGTWASGLMVVSAIVIRFFGDVKESHTKTLIFLGLTALFGGTWGIGTILVIIAGMLMVNRGFKQVKVVKELPSYREVRQTRQETLARIEDEEIVEQETEVEEDNKTLVSEELLEGFEGSEDHKQEIRTWIVMSEFDKQELTPEEIRARAKQEVRNNQLSLETIIALEELEQSKPKEKEKDLTYINMDSLTTDEQEDYEKEDGKEELPETDLENISLEEILGDWDE